MKEFSAYKRYTLELLLVFVALNAFGGGIYGISGAEDVPTEWLNGTPFNNYFIPSVILFVIVGGSFLLASIAVFAKHRLARQAVFGAATILLLWLTVQIIFIGYVSWMQPTFVVIALLVLILREKLPINSN